MMLLRALSVSIAILGVLGTIRTNAEDAVDGFVARTHRGAAGTDMPYRLFIPNAATRVRALPLIVYLHGGGGNGTDNLRQIGGGNTGGTRLWTASAMQARHPAFVVAPQKPGDNTWSAPDSDQPAPYAKLVLELVASLSKEFAIDAGRIYLIGQSAGGRGAWDLVSKRPDLFAAAVPVCGDGNTTRVRAARDVAIWAFHGAKDPVIPVQGSRDLVAALRSTGSSVQYTEYPDVEHDAWISAFAERDLADWLFAQTRVRR
jgi:predicted peptidase